MLAPFPEQTFQEFGRRAAGWFPPLRSTEDLDDPLQKRRHFERSWVAVAYRYRACAEHNEEFKVLLHNAGDLWREWGADEEQNYRFERCLYEFFLSGLSVFESFAFSLYFVGAVMRPGEFPHAEQPKKITVERTVNAFRASFPEAAITQRLSALPEAPAFETLNTIRNILGHRLAGRRNVHGYSMIQPDGETITRREEIWHLPGSDEQLVFDEQLIQRHFDEVIELLKSLIAASLEFVTANPPAPRG